MEGRLGAALDAELPQDARDVGLYRLLFHEQLTGYLPVRLPAGQVLQDLGLALGKRNDFHLRQLRPDRLGGRDPIHDGHEKAHQDHVGLELPGHLQGLLAVLRFADHLELRVEREEHPQALAHHAVVVGYQDPYRHYPSYDFGPRLSPRRRSMAMFVPLPDGPVSTFAIASKTGDPPAPRAAAL